MGTQVHTHKSVEWNGTLHLVEEPSMREQEQTMEIKLLKMEVDRLRKQLADSMVAGHNAENKIAKLRQELANRPDAVTAFRALQETKGSTVRELARMAAALGVVPEFKTRPLRKNKAKGRK